MNEVFKEYRNKLTLQFFNKNLTKSDICTTIKYDCIPQSHHLKITNISMGEPILVNPNSFATLRQVMDNLINETIIDSKRWCSIGCDGNPYLVCCKLIRTTYDCNECNNTVSCTTPEEFVQHMLGHGI